MVVWGWGGEKREREASRKEKNKVKADVVEGLCSIGVKR